VRIVWKHFPLDMHKDAPLAHLASVAAAEQGKFWEYHDKLFGNPGKLKADELRQYARQIGLDMKRFEDYLIAARGKPAIDADLSEGRALGLTGTPAFFVNGRFLSGAKPFEEFAKLINEELAKRNIAPPPGTPTS
jgi:protein-disulfide isomerase